MSYLRCLCLLTLSDVHHILCCVCLRIVCPVLPVSLGCSFFIAHSVFSNVYLRLCTLNATLNNISVIYIGQYYWQ
jgi:hypothetical protein